MDGDISQPFLDDTESRNEGLTTMNWFCFCFFFTNKQGFITDRIRHLN
jgi:hypothetical protein